MQKNNIDFGKENIPELFRKIFIPTLLGMLATALIIVIDGIFVGRGIGSNGLAAVNIAAPFFMIFAGLGLMFGIGASVVVSIHLSKSNIKAANINFTQSMAVSVTSMIFLTILLLVFNRQLAYLFGSSDKLLPLVLEYMNWFIPFSVFGMITVIGLFFIRLDGSPKYAMYCNIIPAVLNVILDYMFIFPFGWGLKGAAIASGISMTIGGTMVLIYLFFLSKTLHFYKLKASRKSLLLMARNIGYMMKLGGSALLGEVSIAFMMVTGNYVFINLLGEDGVAAFSIACYCFPILFMVGNAIAQSAQPIISFNHGAGDRQRVSQARGLSIKTALILGLGISLMFIFLSDSVVALFLKPSFNAYHIAVQGIPYFGVGFLFFIFNIVSVGYFQSIENHRRATAYTLLRGYLLMYICFTILPDFLGTMGAWLAVPCAEFLTTILVVIYFVKSNKRKRRLSWTLK